MHYDDSRSMAQQAERDERLGRLVTASCPCRHTGRQHGARPMLAELADGRSPHSQRTYLRALLCSAGREMGRRLWNPGRGKDETCLHGIY